MKESASVVVIGGGVAGTSVAYHLAQRGLKGVVLLEQGSLASGSSSKSDGIVERQFVSEFDIMLRIKSFEILHELINNGSNINFVPIGYLRLASEESDAQKYRESVKLQHSLGINDTRFLKREEIKQLLPFLKVDDLLCGLYCPSDGMIDGSQLATSFAKQTEKLGGTIVQFTPVVGIKQSSDARRYLVETTQGHIRCDYVVNAAGGWSSAIAKMLGTYIPVKPVRRQIVVLEVPYQDAGMMPFFIDMRSRLYMHGSGGRKTVHAGIHQDVDLDAEPSADPGAFDTGVDFKFTEQVAQAVESRAPGLSGATVKGGWAGLYEITPDSRPILGEVPGLPRFVNCTGFSGYGIQLSPIAGKLISELIVDGKTRTIENISQLEIGRFAKNSRSSYSLF